MEKTFDMGNFRISLQFNPERIKSSAAKVDQESIDKRPCFLCAENRPEEQESFLYKDRYLFLCNPYPIFRSHLTISENNHTPQTIAGKFPDLLEISRDLPQMVVFYNGPKCGASAPDHMHFQAGNLGLISMESDYELLLNTYGKLISESGDVTTISIDDGLRRFFVLESSNYTSLSEQFDRIVSYVDQSLNEIEPMMNILSYYRDYWRVFIFFRDRHRPDQYFYEDGSQILFSPAAVDLGGTMILPVESDFIKIDEPLIRDMYQQVTISNDRFQSIISQIKRPKSAIR
jgi:hypothetical protein